MDHYRKYLGTMTFERWLLLAGSCVVVVALVWALFSTLDKVSGARDEINDAHLSIDAAEHEVTESAKSLAKFVGVLEGMGHELKGLSTNIERSEAACHKVARQTPESRGNPARAFSHYEFCMSHHGWRPVGWKG